MKDIFREIKKDRVFQMLFALPGIVIIFSLAVIFLRKNDIKLPQLHTQPRENQYVANNILFVEEVTPNNTVALPKKIVFRFSDPVDEHTFAHYFYIRPSIPGSIHQGTADNIIEFIPDAPFEKSIIVSVKIEAGMTSKNNKVLLDDYNTGFTTELKDEEVQFVSDNFVGRVFTFPSNKPVKILARKSGNIDQINVSLYRSTQAHLLNYLVYDMKEDKYGYKNLTYVNKNIEHSPADLIAERVIDNEEDQTYNLAPGIYYIEAKVGGELVAGSSVIIVNSLGVIVRQDDKKISFSTFDLATNQSVAHGATVGLYNMDGAPHQLDVHTYYQFEASYPYALSNNVDLVIGTVNGESVFVPLKLPQSQADIQATNMDELYKVFVYTDRPIYKPNDTVKFSGIVRIDSDSQYKLAPTGKQLRVRSEFNDKDIDMTVTTDTHGGFSGEFKIPDDYEGTGWFSVSSPSEIDRYRYYTSANFEVVRYIKPKFELTTSVVKPEYIRGDTVQFAVNGKYFDGTPLKNEEVTYAIYAQNYYEVEKTVYNKNFNVTAPGGMCGGGGFGDSEYFGEPVIKETKLTLNNNGTGNVQFTLPPEITSSKTITLVAKKTDEVNNEIVSASNTVVHSSNFNIFFMPSAESYKSNEEVVAPFYAEDLNGQKAANKEFTYKFTSLVYENGNQKTEVLTSGTVTTDANGAGSVQFTAPDKATQGSTYLVVGTTDNAGNASEASKYVWIRQSDLDLKEYKYWDTGRTDQTYLNITSSKNNFKVGDRIFLKIRSPIDLDTVVSFERGRLYRPEVVRLKKGDNTYSIDVTPELSPSITVVFSFFADGEYHTEGVALNVPAMHKLLNVSMKFDKQRYNPQETANLTINTSDADGNPVPANLTLNIVDKAIFALRKSATPPVHSSMYYFRPRSTNASSSLTPVGYFEYGGRGGGGGGAGGGLGSAVDTLYWNADLATGTNGELMVQVPLKGYETTWKAMVIGSTDTTQVGQTDIEFVVAGNVLGTQTRWR